ncbi:hypothetical protein [Pseudomonas sp. TWR1-1-4]|uniref:hypothetical protein n=1 Tax=Pseudomonas sp. TWR1-1-4 TaxID=2804604 RepID=UPI003CEC56CE
MPNVFFSYCHADEALRDQLEKQLSMLKRQGVIETWHDRRIGAGQEIDAAIDDHINSDEINSVAGEPRLHRFRLLLQHRDDSRDGASWSGGSDRHSCNSWPCDWHHAPFGKLLGTPQDGKPVTLWPDRDGAFLQVAKEVRKATERCSRDRPSSAPKAERNDFTGGSAPSPSHGDSFGGGSYNEALTVETDDQSMYLKTFGMAFHTRQDQKLSQEGGAETFWSLLIAPLQRNR